MLQFVLIWILKFFSTHTNKKKIREAIFCIIYIYFINFFLSNIDFKSLKSVEFFECLIDWRSTFPFFKSNKSVVKPSLLLFICGFSLKLTSGFLFSISLLGLKTSFSFWEFSFIEIKIKYLLMKKLNSKKFITFLARITLWLKSLKILRNSSKLKVAPSSQ